MHNLIHMYVHIHCIYVFFMTKSIYVHVLVNFTNTAPSHSGTLYVLFIVDYCLATIESIGKKKTKKNKQKNCSGLWVIITEVGQ